ncbi:MAG: YggS family pyridoxal phosphate-dependent enzyme [Planctomycetota bacterium]
MSDALPPIARNLAEVRGRIADAAAAARRPADAVTLVAVTKYAEPAWVEELLRLGVRDLGENYPQQLCERADAITAPDPPPVRWHMIGTLQRNKARKLLPHAALVHSVDSVKLATTLDRIAGELGFRDPAPVLLQVNVSGEESKSGFDADSVTATAEGLAALGHIDIRGLTTIAPATDDPATTRPVFAALRDLRDALAARTGLALSHLSMGMSGDYEIAVQEGATLVRVGGALYRRDESP